MLHTYWCFFNLNLAKHNALNLRKDAEVGMFLRE